MTEKNPLSVIAVTLERIRSIGKRFFNRNFAVENSTWEEAKFSVTDRLIYLIADGAYSTSGQHHWSNTLESLFSNNGLTGIVKPFSYSGYGNQYHPDHTIGNVRDIQNMWVEHLDYLTDSQLVIPICFSLGASVAVTGTAQWLEANKVNTVEQIPAVILVAPALTPARLILDSYLEYYSSAGIKGEIPLLVYQLCDEHSRLRTEIIDAIDIIVKKNIDLHIIYWPDDVITPHDKVDSPVNDYSIELPVQDLTSNVVSNHLLVRDAQATKDALLDIVKQYE